MLPQDIIYNGVFKGAISKGCDQKTAGDYAAHAVKEWRTRGGKAIDIINNNVKLALKVNGKRK